jgi:DNA-binding CsgD family transcriptional regulator
MLSRAQEFKSLLGHRVEPPRLLSRWGSPASDVDTSARCRNGYINRPSAAMPCSTGTRRRNRTGSTQPAGPLDALAPLTVRALEVLPLIARGLSNAEVAGEITVVETTVRTHVTRILSELGIRHRVQAVVLAYESGFVTRSRWYGPPVSPRAFVFSIGVLG